MKCPFCSHPETKVIDKRESEEDSNRRRRECLSCGKRFTTYEKLELSSSKKVDKLVKRDGRIADFDASRIESAIFKAAKAVGGTDRERAKKLADEVMEQVNKKFLGKKDLPTVEDIQDIVEKVLIENGHAKTAKAYIIYRQERAELRNEKRRILEKEDVDDVDKVFDLNALRVLKSRYLRKDENGKLIETPKQLFTRVATHGALPDILYDPQLYDISKSQQQHPKESFDPKTNHEKYSIGKYKLNQYHLDAFKRMYDRFNKNHQMKFSWSQVLEKLSKGELSSYEKNITEFYDIMVNRQFMPNTPAIANFGTVLGMGSACFVLGIRDSIDDIMEKLKHAAVIFKSGGGVGYNFSHLRPEGDLVSSTCGLASGPLSFMSMFDKMTEVIKQGGIRRGANMGIMNSDHPDIEKFITAKAGNKAFKNFNISVNIQPDFWQYYEKNEPYPLRNPRDGTVVKTVNSRMLFDKIVYQAWESAEPGVIFSDKVNEYNPLYESMGPIETTNPCGEVLLYPNESCNLGSINVWAFVKEDVDGNVSFDWENLARVSRLGEKFLDNVIEVNKWPLQDIEDMALNTRKTGLGVMGVGDLLYELGLPYNTDEGRNFMERLMEFVNFYSKVEGIELARTRGPFLYYDKSFYSEGKLPFAGFYDKKSWRMDWNQIVDGVQKHGVRNAFTIVVAPTGSISMIAGCSSGIEPVYSLVFEKNVKVGSFYYVNPIFEKWMRREGLFDEKLVEDVNANKGTVRRVGYIPRKFKEMFITAMDTTPEDHIRALAAFQKWVDSSISKTNNFPADATVEDMRQSYLLAYKLGCKDVTVFRDTSIKDQVLVSGVKKSEKHAADTGLKPQLGKEWTPEQPIAVSTSGSFYQQPKVTTNFGEKPKVCPSCGSETKREEGCVSCPGCGWGMCS